MNLSSDLFALQSKRDELICQLEVLEIVIRNFEQQERQRNLMLFVTVGLVPAPGDQFSNLDRRQLEEHQLRLMQQRDLIEDLLAPDHGFSAQEFESRVGKALRKITIFPSSKPQDDLAPR